MNRPTLLALVLLPSFSALAGCGSPSSSEAASGSTALADTAAQTLTGIGGKCLDDFTGGTADGNPVGIWDCDGESWQDWTYTSQTIVGAGGKCLDVARGATADGTVVRLWTCNGSGAQTWTRSGNELVNPQSGKCLDVTGNVETNGALAQIWDCWNGPNQQWSFADGSVPPTPAPAPDAGGGSGGGSTGGASNATRVRDFIDTLGANQHLGWGGTSYDNISLEISELTYLGIRHVRDCPADWDLGDHVQIAKAGFKYDCPVGQGDVNIDIAGELATFANLDAQVPGAFDGIEGPNELNGSSVRLNSVSSVDHPAVAVQIQQQLFAQVRALHAFDGAVVINNSTTGGYSDAWGNWQTYIDGEGNMAAEADMGNWHVYNYYAPLGSNLASGIGYAKQVVPGNAPAVTELGYSTTYIDEGSAGRWTVDGWLDAYEDGARKMYVYELMDGQTGDSDPENNFGMFHTDGSAKPAADGVHNLTSILTDPGSSAASFSPGSLGYSVSGLPASGHALLLAKSDGTFDIVVWSSETGGQTSEATLSLSTAASSLSVYDVMQGTTPTQTTRATSKVTLSLTDRPFVVAVTP